ncbi:MAG: hypothetical protein ACRD1T_17200 [Acidimicrobiia bacterium]
MRRLKVGLPSLLATSLMWASSGFGQSGTAQVDRDMAEVHNYRLTMANVRQIAEAYKAIFAAVEKDPRAQALMKLEAELEILQAKDEPTEADMKRIEALEQQIEQGKAPFQGLSVNVNEKKTLTEMAQAIEAEPILARAVRAAGFTPRQFVTAQMAFFEAMLTHGFMKAGGVKEPPKGVPIENLKFVQENEAELTKLFQELEALGKKRTP